MRIGAGINSVPCISTGISDENFTGLRKETAGSRTQCPGRW